MGGIQYLGEGGAGVQTSGLQGVYILLITCVLGIVSTIWTHVKHHKPAHKAKDIVHAFVAAMAYARNLKKERKRGAAGNGGVG